MFFVDIFIFIILCNQLDGKDPIELITKNRETMKSMGSGGGGGGAAPAAGGAAAGGDAPAAAAAVEEEEEEEDMDFDLFG